MAKFLLLYRTDASAAEQMANATPEQQQAGMQAWMDWFGRAGDVIVDGGSPVQSESGIGGYSILEAPSRQEIDAVLEGHPHLGGRHHRGGRVPSCAGRIRRAPAAAL
ncbi:hypothetical protein [Nocardioides sp.]|uniref:hypothetical protein n=1 Tax=Nocardioides sp. TaxID=35761 RepID=UPI00261EB6A6|nr:hypothetical protein [Nocardioides sp.]